jgi:hypothetical protein
MKSNRKMSKPLTIIAGILAFLCVAAYFVLFGLPAIQKWRDKAYFYNHRQVFEDVASLAEDADCEGRCIEPMPESALASLKHNGWDGWLLCYFGDELSFVSWSTPSGNSYVYAANPDRFPNSPTCGYGFTGLDRLDDHWYFAKVIVYGG